MPKQALILGGTNAEVAELSDITGGALDVQEEGVGAGTRSTINFIGAAVTAADNPGEGRVDITVSSGAVTAPVTGDQATGSFTIATGKFGLQGMNLTLASSERGTIEVTGRLLILG